MAYATQSDIENIFGTTNVQLWSQLSPDSSAVDANRITAALAYAEAYVEDRFRGGRYQVPFSGTSVILTSWVAKIAGVWLYESRAMRGNEETNPVAVHKATANDEMTLYASGQRRLPLAASESGPTCPVVV
jgi:phage gp36-like protein